MSWRHWFARLPECWLRSVRALVALSAAAASVNAQAIDVAAQSRLLDRAAAAVVGLRSQAVDDARSNRTLGREREGSGVVIDGDGLVLTIGYLILEAEQVQLVTDDDREIPGRVVAYDMATGFGLVQPLTPLRIEAVPLGRSGGVAQDEPLMVVSGGNGGVVSAVRLVSRRTFAGYWEYRIDDALFTAPARGDHSGAGLFNGRGELVGIGSLIVAHAMGDKQPRLPGNMFVPVDLLSPILDELRRSGTSAASRRAWMGVNCVEDDGEVRVVRVNDDSPADVAGVQVGDRILRIDDVSVRTLEQLWLALWRNGPPEREVRLEIQRDGARQTLRVFTVERSKTLKRSQGV
ncbi:MAG TPA: S1C family serine protease [Burkholderiaceae bacterium]|nr:S1C family serine protease [Burkholderiaceae bacterium]